MVLVLAVAVAAAVSALLLLHAPRAHVLPVEAVDGYTTGAALYAYTSSRLTVRLACMDSVVEVVVVHGSGYERFQLAGCGSREIGVEPGLVLVYIRVVGGGGGAGWVELVVRGWLFS